MKECRYSDKPWTRYIAINIGEGFTPLLPTHSW